MIGEQSSVLPAVKLHKYSSPAPSAVPFPLPSRGFPQLSKIPGSSLTRYVAFASNGAAGYAENDLKSVPAVTDPSTTPTQLPVASCFSRRILATVKVVTSISSENIAWIGADWHTSVSPFVGYTVLTVGNVLSVSLPVVKVHTFSRSRLVPAVLCT